MQTNLQQEAETARMMIEAGGDKAFVLAAAISNNRVTMTRGISENTTRRDAMCWIVALNEERWRVARMLGVDPDTVEGERLE